MSRLPPRRLPVPPGPDGVTAVAAALRELLAGGERAIAVAPEAGPGTPAHHHAAAMSAALREDAPMDTDGVALIVATSGSTGEPQGVLIPLQALLAACDAGAAAAGPRGLWLAAVPVTGIGGLLAVLRSLRAGLDPVALASIGGATPFTPVAFCDTARSALERAASLGVPGYVSLVPTQLRRLVGDGPRSLDVLAGFGAVVVGGAAIADRDKQAAARHGVRIIESYGATETCGGVVYNGTPLPGVTVTFEDPDAGTTLVDGPGRIVIGGSTLALGYRLRPDLTAAAFRADGFRTSDHGLRVDGRVTVAGRLDHIVKVGGVKVSLSAVANALRGHPRILDAVAIAEPDPEWGQVPVAYVVTDSSAVDEDGLRDELINLVADRCGRAAAPRRIVCVDHLPVTHSGKTTVR